MCNENSKVTFMFVYIIYFFSLMKVKWPNQNKDLLHSQIKLFTQVYYLLSYGACTWVVRKWN
jgi:hypothetical protein